MRGRCIRSLSRPCQKRPLPGPSDFQNRQLPPQPVTQFDKPLDGMFRILHQIRPDNSGSDDDDRFSLDPRPKRQFAEIIVFRDQRAPFIRGPRQNIQIPGAGCSVDDIDHIDKTQPQGFKDRPRHTFIDEEPQFYSAASTRQAARLSAA